jgi:hypothetical protein
MSGWLRKHTLAASRHAATPRTPALPATAAPRPALVYNDITPLTHTRAQVIASRHPCMSLQRVTCTPALRCCCRACARPLAHMLQHLQPANALHHSRHQAAHRCAQMRRGVVPMGFTSSTGLLRMKSAQCLGIRFASVTASHRASRATWFGDVCVCVCVLGGGGEGARPRHGGVIFGCRGSGVCTARLACMAQHSPGRTTPERDAALRVSPPRRHKRAPRAWPPRTAAAPRPPLSSAAWAPAQRRPLGPPRAPATGC